MENKERENKSTSTRRSNSVERSDHLEMKFRGNKYDTQFTRPGKNKTL